MNVLEAPPFTTQCLSESEIWSHLDDNSDVSQQKHLKQCEHCQSRLQELLEDLNSLRMFDANTHASKSSSVNNIRFCEGQRIGKYEVLEVISSGGQGIVYRGWDAELQRVVAIKVGENRVPTNLNERSRIHQEGVFLAEIQHPNLAQIYDSGMHDLHPFLVMEYVEGMTLQQLIATRDLTEEQIRQIMTQLTSALRLCHEQRILHLDIKPENIIVSDQLEVKLIDFGVSWRTTADGNSQSIVAGTLEFMAPEQMIGNTYEWSERTDIYGLGALLLCLLTGFTPNEKPLEQHEAWLREVLNQADCSRSLKVTCLTALALNPQDRFGSVIEFQQSMTGNTRPLGVLFILIGSLLIACGLYFSVQAKPEYDYKIEKVPTTVSIGPKTEEILLDESMFPKNNTALKSVVPSSKMMAYSSTVRD